jgi:glycosyltransferase involved in cell wall biosynthesis
VVLFAADDGSLKSARQIHEAIVRRSKDFDVIHIHSMWNLAVTFAAAAARKVRVPYILAPRGMLSDVCLRQSRHSMKRAYAWSYDRRTVEGARRLHFLNADEQKASQNSWFRYPESFLAPNGSELSAGAIPRGLFHRRFPELEGRRMMLFLGRLHAIKGLDLQLEALAQLIAIHPDLIWLLVGPDDGEWSRLQALVSKAGLAENVKWVGPVMGDERFSALADADVVVQTSFYECQSMTVNEALAVGVPLVVTDSINYSEVQKSGAGYVVGRDSGELAKAIDVILQDPDKGEAMRIAGRRFATEELSWSKIASIVNGAYSDAVEGFRNQDKGQKVRCEIEIGMGA